MVFNQVLNQLQALAGMVGALTDDQYVRPTRHLGGASIGGHTRHIVEILQCTVQGYALGRIDYHNRIRDLQLEQDRSRVLVLINQLMATLRQQDKAIRLVAVTDQGNEQACVQTSYFREITFNAEHATHHMALIKVALIDMDLSIVADDFGVAAATQKFKASQACAQ